MLEEALVWELPEGLSTSIQSSKIDRECHLFLEQVVQWTTSSNSNSNNHNILNSHGHNCRTLVGVRRDHGKTNRLESRDRRYEQEGTTNATVTVMTIANVSL